jgi:YkoY family integral membrane protein
MSRLTRQGPDGFASASPALFARTRQTRVVSDDALFDDQKRAVTPSPVDTLLSAVSVIQPSDLLTVALLVGLEGLLSADNAMVLAVLVLGLPKGEQRQALRYGIVGAFAFRAIATLLAAYLIRLGWVKLVGAGYLLYLVYRHFGSGEGSGDRRTPSRARPWLGLTAFWSTVVKVELTDIVFAVDSILVAVAMSPKMWVILTGGILGILMMRLVIGQLLSLVERYPPLVDGAFVIIGWVGVKLLVEYLHTEGHVDFEIPKWLSLGLIVVIFSGSFLYARYQEKRRVRTAAERAVTDLLMDEGDDR